ncbi:RNA helicase [Ceratobasidium sp. 423]|nr:RNA helicase [Ceratobasidium sp. 423]
MSLAAHVDEYDPPSRRDGNNLAPRSSQNKSQLLEATMRNVPKLKELNYTQWKNVITNSIKKAKLWGYVDGSIEEPSEHDASNLATYFDETAAIRNAILGSLESGAQKYIEEALDPRDAWLALERKYLTAEAEADKGMFSTEKQLADLRLEEGGDIVEHVAQFCRIRYQLNGTRFALDDQASISMLYRSLPPSYRQSVLTPDGAEMKDFNALCARLSYLSQNPEPQVDESAAPVEDYTNWGVPEDIKAFGLTGDKNPLLQERAAATCRDCLLKGHKAGTPECPQYGWRKELWGTETNDISPAATDPGNGPLADQLVPVNTKRLSYEFSEPVKVVLDFDELGLKPNLRQKLSSNSMATPWAIQQCAILPIINGHNVLAQAPSNNGKTTALAISIIQIIDTQFPHAQALVFTSTSEAATAFQNTVNNLGSYSARCYSCDSSGSPSMPNLSSLSKINNHHIFVGTPSYILGLISRNIINTRKLRTMVLDDIDKLVEAGAEDQILEAYRHVPPLTQIIASSSICSLSTSKTISKLLANPVQISVNRNEGVTIGTHFYVKVPASEKPNALYAAYTTLGTNAVMVLCRDLAEASFSGYQWPKQYGYYYLRESMEPDERESVIRNFRNKRSSLSSRNSGYGSYYGQRPDVDPVWAIAMVATDATLSTTVLSSINVPLINYDIPNNVEDYIKRLEQWRIVDPGQSNTILTFVTADTNEALVIQDLEQCYGVHVVEVVWKGGRLY